MRWEGIIDFSTRKTSCFYVYLVHWLLSTSSYFIFLSHFSLSLSEKCLKSPSVNPSKSLNSNLFQDSIPLPHSLSFISLFLATATSLSPPTSSPLSNHPVSSKSFDFSLEKTSILVSDSSSVKIVTKKTLHLAIILYVTINKWQE